MNKSDIKILIVDDVSELRAFLTGCLKQLGFTNVSQAPDGINAMQQLKRNPKEVVFLDIEMPKQNGIETLKEIHQLNPDTFVIMLSCYSSLDNVKEAISSGASGFIVKPFSADKVKESLLHFTKNYVAKRREEAVKKDIWGSKEAE
ncbi:MAG: response regulator [Psychrosphaera sp.]|nr:response regulator [Psychrosphaera sp.]